MTAILQYLTKVYDIFDVTNNMPRLENKVTFQFKTYPNMPIYQMTTITKMTSWNLQ